MYNLIVLMADFLFTYAGMYLAQSLCHSAVAAAVADSSLLAWRIMDPRVKQRFRLIVIIAPVVSFPLYQLINPGRGSIYFRLDALFDVNRWFFLEVFGLFTIWTATLAIIVLTALIFIVQELIPIVLHLIEVRRTGPLDAASGPPDAAHDRAIRILDEALEKGVIKSLAEYNRLVARAEIRQSNAARSARFW
ncbi:hypothetical protein LCGC14_2205820, partial [marine sediment metagenome]